MGVFTVAINKTKHYISRGVIRYIDGCCSRKHFSFYEILKFEFDNAQEESFVSP